MANPGHPHELTATEATQPGGGRLQERSRVAEDLRDLVLVLARAATDSGNRMPLDDVLRAFGHTRESLAKLPDDD